MSLRDKFRDQPEVLPLEGIDQAVPTDDFAGLSIEELAKVVAERRQQALAERDAARQDPGAVVEEGEKSNPRRGGAFGGALKRRIERTNSAERLAATNAYDIDLLKPTSVNTELFPSQRGNLAYRGVLFTPREYGALTISPAELARRIGAKVLSSPKDRTPTEKHARRQELVVQGLLQRQQKVQIELVRLESEAAQLERLQKEMKSPGYSHMSMEQIDGLMAAAEKVYVDMFTAIVENHGLPTERTQSLTAAMEYLVTADDYKATFKYHKAMANLAHSWVRAKISRFIPIEENIAEELAKQLRA
jgi:hypothetical protein